ncbi:hypothetical protein GMMP1_430010 [Candidatus Magnetomoraceae bacterium gMMP-1]
MRKHIILFCIFTFIIGSTVFAEEVHKLEEVVVTATHKMKMLDTPASISIITADELEDMGAKNIIEALKKSPVLLIKVPKMMLFLSEGRRVQWLEGL